MVSGASHIITEAWVHSPALSSPLKFLTDKKIETQTWQVFCIYSKVQIFSPHALCFNIKNLPRTDQRECL